MSRMFHAYLLLSNEYYRLLVQSEAQYGFEPDKLNVRFEAFVSIAAAMIWLA